MVLRSIKEKKVQGRKCELWEVWGVEKARSERNKKEKRMGGCGFKRKRKKKGEGRRKGVGVVAKAMRVWEWW